MKRVSRVLNYPVYYDFQLKLNTGVNLQGECLEDKSRRQLIEENTDCH